MTKKNIVIIGAGFGGLAAAKKLGTSIRKLGLSGSHKIILIDRNKYHTFTPLLYKVASSFSVNKDKNFIRGISGYDIKEIVSDWNVEFINSEVSNLDIQEGDIHLSSGEELICEYLLLAPGGSINYFGIKGMKENSITLKSMEGAIKIRERIMELLSRLEKPVIVIGGAGPAGTELAAELKHNESKLNVILVEAMPQILPGLDVDISKKAKTRLEKIGVGIKVNWPIQTVDNSKVVSKDGSKIDYDLLVWAGGITGSPLINDIPLKTERRGQISVEQQMTCFPKEPDLKIKPKIYAIGDSVCYFDPETGKPVPWVARTAMRQGQVAATNIIADIKTDEDMAKIAKHKAYRHIEYPHIVPVGGKYALSKIGPFIIRGILGWLFEVAIHLNYLLSIMRPIRAIKIWSKRFYI